MSLLLESGDAPVELVVAELHHRPRFLSGPIDLFIEMIETAQQLLARFEHRFGDELHLVVHGFDGEADPVIHLIAEIANTRIHLVKASIDRFKASIDRFKASIDGVKSGIDGVKSGIEGVKSGIHPRKHRSQFFVTHPKSSYLGFSKHLRNLSIPSSIFAVEIPPYPRTIPGCRGVPLQ